MATVAVLGTGLLGSGFAQNLLAKGHAVRVWNRTATRCRPMVEAGATAADTPAEAARGADRVHLVLTADDAVDAVIEALRPGLGDGVPVIDHSTNLPARVAERFARLADQGVRYVPAPVFMSPANARNATGMMVVSGPPIDDLAVALEEMTGTLRVLSARPDHAAIVKLQGNALMFMLTAAVADAVAIGRGAGLTEDEASALFDSFKPDAAFIARRVANAGNAPASFELAMARKDAALAAETALGELLVLPAVAAAMDRAIDAGKADVDYAVFAKR